MTLIAIIIATIVCVVVYAERNGGILRDALDSAFGVIVPASIIVGLLLVVVFNSAPPSA